MPESEDPKDPLLLLAKTADLLSKHYYADHESLPELEDLRNALLALPLRCDPSLEDLLFKGVWLTVLNNILGNKYVSAGKAVSVFNSLLERAMQVVVANADSLEKDGRLQALLSALTSPDKEYYKDKNQIDLFQTRPWEGLAVTQTEFVQGLQEGDMVDAVKFENNLSVAGWVKAKVLKVFPSLFTLRSVGDKLGATFILKRPTAEIEPYGTRTAGDDWRYSLQPGDIIDCFDSYFCWYNSTVISVDRRERASEFNENQTDQAIEYKIGFRVYVDDQKAANRRYEGWSQHYDENVAAGSPRIRQRGTLARGMEYQAKQVTDYLQDHNDLVFDEVCGQQITVIPRKKMCSKPLLSVAGIFHDELLKQLESRIVQNDDLNFEAFSCYVTAVARMSPLLHRKRVTRLIGEVAPAIESYILENIEKHIKLMTTERMNQLFESLSVLLKRTYSDKDLKDFKYRIRLQIALKGFGSELLTRKIHSLNEFKEILGQMPKTQSLEPLKERILAERIFEKVFGPDSHSELIKRGQELLKFMLTEGLLEHGQLQSLWACAQQDSESKKTIYKMLEDLSYYIKQSQSQFLLNKLFLIEPTGISQEDLDLLAELSKSSIYSSFIDSYFEQIIRFYLKALSSLIPVEFLQSITLKMSDSINRHAFREEAGLSKADIVLACFPNLEHDVNPILTMRFLKKIINSTLQPQAIRCLQLCLQRLLALREQDPVRFLAQFNERLEFIYFIFEECKDYLDVCFETLQRLVRQFVSEGNKPQEREKFFMWLNKVLANVDREKTKPEFVQQIFQRMTAVDLSTLSEEGFNCIKRLFLMQNHNQGLLALSGSSVFLRVSPEELASYDIVQSLIKSHPQEEVANLAIDFYFQLHAKQEGEAVLGAIIADLRNSVEKGQEVGSCRYIRMINCLIDESEKEGNFKVESLWSLAKEETFTLTVFCQEYYYSYSRKIELAVDSNMTLFKLKEKIAEMTSFSFKEIKPVFKRELGDRFNCWTMRELGIRAGDSIHVTRKGDYSAKEHLIVDKEINPKAVRVFQIIFDRYSTGGLMSKEQCREFTRAVIGLTSCHDDRISSIYRDYDSNQDGFLEKKEFVNFYVKASFDKPSIVWENLKNIGVSSNLTFPEEKLLPCGFRMLPRETLSADQSFFDLLFSQLDKPRVAKEAWQLIYRLPPSSTLKELVQSTNLESEKLIEILNPSSPYKLQYLLLLVQLNLEQKLVDYADRFIEAGAFLHLLRTFKQLCGQETRTQALEETILSVISLLYTCSIPDEKIARGHILFRGDYSLEEIINYVENESSIEQCVRLIENMEKKAKDKDKEISKDMKRLVSQYAKYKSFKIDMRLWRSSSEQALSEAMRAEGFFQFALGQLKREHEDEGEVVLKLCEILLARFISSPSDMESQLPSIVAILNGKHNIPLTVVMLIATLLVSEPLPRLTEAVVARLASKPEQPHYYSLLSILVKKSQLKPDISGVLLGYLEEEKNENLITGLLRVLKELNGIHGAIRLWETCLFGQAKTCCSNDTRKMAYQLVTNICKEFPQEREELFRKKLVPLVADLPCFPDRLSASWNQSRSACGYSGIRNPQAVCYMISMLQQFFMILPFRNGILATDDGKVPALELDKKGRTYDDNVLHQLQALYTRLLKSERRDVQILDLCSSFKDFDGQPVDLTVQQDAYQFLNRIFDKLEQSLKGTPYEKLLDSVFGGKFCHSNTCEECNFTWKTYESFFNISLEVRGKKTLFQSLSKFTSEERISDYRCDNCQRKVTIKKRALFEEGPNVLIVHLQRIVFNFDIFINEKINSRLEFPHEVSLAPFSAHQDEKEQEQDYEYVLKGIVCHNGTAEFGHYYSYIEVNPDHWLEFNDSTVRSFNKSQIEAQCFGGLTDDEDWKKEEITYSAYMLFYERIRKKPILLLQDLPVAAPEPELKKTPSKADGEDQQPLKEPEPATERRPVPVDYYGLQETLDPTLVGQVSQDNSRFELQKFLLSGSFNSFLVGFFELVDFTGIDAASAQSYFDLLVKSIFKMFVKAPNPENFEIVELVKQLSRVLTQFPELSEQSTEFIRLGTSKLEEEPLVELLIGSSEEELRAASSLLLQSTIAISYDRNEELTESFLKGLLDLMPTYVAKNWTKLNSYFQFWHELVQSSRKVEGLFVRLGMPIKLLDYFMEKKSPLSIYSSRKNNFENKSFSPNYAALFQLFMHFFKRHPETIPAASLKEFAASPEFAEKLLAEKAAGELLATLCKDHCLFSELVCYQILRGLERSENFSEVVGNMVQVLLIEDRLQVHRIRMVLGFWQANTLKPETYVRLSYESALSLEFKSCVLDYLCKSRIRNQANYMRLFMAFLDLLENPVIRAYATALPIYSTEFSTVGNNYFAYVDSELVKLLAEIKRYSNSTKRLEEFEELKERWHSLKDSLTACPAPVVPELSAVSLDDELVPVEGEFYLKKEHGVTTLLYKNKYNDCRVFVKLREGDEEQLAAGQGELVVVSKVSKYSNYFVVYTSLKQLAVDHTVVEKEKEYLRCKTRLLLL